MCSRSGVLCGALQLAPPSLPAKEGSAGWSRVWDLANKYIGCPVKIVVGLNNNYLFRSLFILYPMQYLGHTDAKNLLLI